MPESGIAACATTSRTVISTPTRNVRTTAVTCHVHQASLLGRVGVSVGCGLGLLVAIAICPEAAGGIG
jgi:hypothetical protein